MQRGNHETKNMNKIYGFEGEVKHKYDDTVMNLFTDVFNWLPIATTISNKSLDAGVAWSETPLKSIFVVHGGLRYVTVCCCIVCCVLSCCMLFILLYHRYNPLSSCSFS